MNKISRNLKALIIGGGTIGERHLYNLKKIGIKKIGIFDLDNKKTKFLASKYNVQNFSSLNSALKFHPDFSLICTYPSSHVKIANKLADLNSHVFVEKPISSDVNGVKKMLKKFEKKRLHVAVGYNMRFDKGLRFMKKQLQQKLQDPMLISSKWGLNIKSWHPGSNYKNHYILKKGGGIILDDSHEFDYVRWLLDDNVKSVYCQTKKLKKIKTQTESLAVLILKFKRGTIANFVIDYVRPEYQRECHIMHENNDLHWNFLTKGSTWKKDGPKVDSIVTTNVVNGSKKTRKFRYNPNEMYLDEITDFIESISRDKKPIIDGWDGLKTLQIAQAALESAKNDKIISLNSKI